MKRFLSTTAVLFALTGTAYADAHASGFGNVTFEQSDFYASDLIGMRVYNSETEMDADAMVQDGAETEWEDIGEINDIIVSADGDIRAVILGVGGFLGIGERDVSISMDAIKVVREEGDSNDRFLVVTTTKEMLENAPAFERDMTNTGMTGQDSAALNSDMTNSDLLRPNMSYEGYTDVDMAEASQLTADEIQGAYVYGANDETVGEIGALLMSDDGKISDAVINVGGFLGLGEKPVAVNFEQIQVLKNVDGDEYRFYIDSTKEKLEALPEYNG